MRKMTKRSAIITGVAVVAIGSGAAAFAAGWGVKGSGTGSATASTIQDLKGSASVGDKVFPGAKTTISLTFTNPNDFPVVVDFSSFKPGAPTVKNDDDKKSCATGLASATKLIEDLKPKGAAPKVPGKGGSAEVGADLTVGDLPEACAGKEISFAYTFTGTSAA
ncbi:hypothetical protein [Actinoplanes sp. URMC 104]|uniref:hypothetical protein n=1 Tax=Actinoplanes sp. URMC 104 TaxID=3423409 RepID=UPI003F1BA864